MTDTMPVKPTVRDRTSRFFPRMPSRRLTAAVIAIGGMQLMAVMDGTIAVVALPKVQNELNLSDAGRSWVITAYILAFGGLMLLGGRLGDTFGRKRTFLVGVMMFTAVSALCGIAWDGGALVFARLLQGVSAAVVTPTGMALMATTFPKGPVRNTAMAMLGAMGAVSAVSSMAIGGALSEVSWRLVFLVNVPIGLVVVTLARIGLQETQKERMKLDVTGAALATLMCTAAVFGFSMAPESGWLSAKTIGSGVVAVCALVVFIAVERKAQNPIVPLDLFFNRNRLATFATIFLAGGVLFALTVLIGLYVQDILGYSGLRAGASFIPFAIAVAVGAGVSTRLVTRFAPRIVVLIGGLPVLGAMLYGSTLHRGIPYFPNLVVPLVIAALGIGVINIVLSLSVIASVEFDRIGPVSAIAMMMHTLGAPVILGVISAIVTWRTLSLGGTGGPARSMDPIQLHALDQGYTFGLLWLAGVAVAAGAVALFIGYTAQQVAHAAEVKKAIEAGELELHP